MFPRLNRDSLLGLACVVASLMLMAVWVPADTETGLIEKVRRHVAIGDALAPTLAGLFILVGGLMLALQPAGPDDSSQKKHLAFLIRLLLLLAVSLGLMRWSGPVSVLISNTLTGSDVPYRLLRDTAPWKYVGFALGGMTLVAGLIALIEGRLTWRTLLIALITVLGLIALYDLPFDDLLLPPNGDV